MEENAKVKRKYSRLGTIVAILLALVGLVSLVFSVLPVEWQTPIQGYVADVVNTFQSLGDRRIPLGIGLSCLLAGLLTFIVIVARRKRPMPPTVYRDPGVNLRDNSSLGYWVGNWVAPVSVYFDFENKTIGARQVAPLVRYLHGRIQSLTGSDHADLFFYSDAYNSARTGAYQALQQYGFHAIDVPHRRMDAKTVQRGDRLVTKDNLKNFVDFELSLHAYQRALVTQQPQWIILISEDTDFIPLIRRLRALGHHVQVWSRSAVQEFKVLESTLGIETVAWEDEIRSEIGASGDSLSIQPSKPREARTDDAIASQPIRSLGSDSGQELFNQAINATLHAINTTNRALLTNASAIGSPRGALHARLGSILWKKSSTGLLVLLGYEDPKGYKGRNRVAFWLDELKALDVIFDNNQGQLPTETGASISVAAGLLLGFVQNDISDAIRSTPVTPDGVLPLASICNKIITRATSLDPVPIQKLRELFREDNKGYHLKHAQYLCQCARNLGLVTFSSLISERPSVPDTLSTESSAQ